MNAFSVLTTSPDNLQGQVPLSNPSLNIWEAGKVTQNRLTTFEIRIRGRRDLGQKNDEARESAASGSPEAIFIASTKRRIKSFKAQLRSTLLEGFC